VTRIVAGQFGGRRLEAPPGQHTRPTSDRVREALFSSLDTITYLHGAAFLDLYAGSGAIGLEALSRGAGTVMLVEADARAARTARENVKALGAGAAVRLTTAKVGHFLATAPPTAYDVVFADPPYSAADAEITAMLEQLVGRGWLAGGATVVVERSTRSPDLAWVKGITPIRRRQYGETTLWYGRATIDGGEAASGVEAAT
jgi:16S rRNA (guanine966-N2)-methyltransferase